MQRDLDARKDEEHPNKKKLTLRFDLPRGSYATLVVKRITRVEEMEQAFVSSSHHTRPE